MRLAYFSPLNPQPSGISDYSEELLPYLARGAEIDLFVDGFVPNNPEITNNFRTIDYRRDPSVLLGLRDYDVLLYHMGNDHRYHTGIARVMREHPGIVVLHDFALQDFFLGQATSQKDVRSYLDELEACHGSAERRKAEEYIQRGSLPPQVSSPLAFPLNARLAGSAEGIIVHSEWSRTRLAEIVAGVPIERINHHITARAAATTSHSRRQAGPVRIASFGLVTPDKGIERSLRVLAKITDDHDFHYTLVGPSQNFPALMDLVKSYGLQKHVSITGVVSLDEFERRITETDIAINLRERPVGATSGSLCRIMAAGVAAIVSNVGAFSELPDATVVKIEHDENADALFDAYLRRLIEDQDLRQQIGQNARNHVLAHHRIETSAKRYLEFIHHVIARRPRKQLIHAVTTELTKLNIPVNYDALTRNLAREIAAFAPVAEVVELVPAGKEDLATNVGTGNGHSRPSHPPAAGSPSCADERRRLPKLEDVDYKRAALEYPHLLDAERSYYLRTKPFYNLAHKPLKHSGYGMDPETHRHFSDFSNMAVSLALPAGAKILDVGCGSGWLSEYFARLGYDVTGIDISDDLILMARERVENVPYNLDHERPLQCRFVTHDIEIAPLPTGHGATFDAIICYDSLHHLVDERAVFRHLAAMLDVGGVLFILEGQNPPAGSATEAELLNVMRQYGTLESPFSADYLRQLISEHGFAVVGDYVSVNGLFEREMLEGDSLPLRTIPTDYHYLTCMKVTEAGAATTVPDSYKPGVLRAEFTQRSQLPQHVKAACKLELAITARNAGDTLWLNGQTVRSGIVMPGIRIIDKRGQIISELHGHPMLPRAVPPGCGVDLEIQFVAPKEPGTYTLKIDLVDQHICWFEERGSEPLLLSFDVED